MKFKLLIIVIFIFVKFAHSQANTDSAILSNGYSEIEVTPGMSLDFIKKELVKLASIDAIEKKFGRVLFSENNLEVTNSSTKTNTNFKSTNKSIVKGQVTKVISQIFEENELSNYIEFNGIKKLVLTKILSCKITCELKESPVNIEFSLQIDKIQSEVDSLDKKVNNLNVNIQTLQNTNTIINASTLEEQMYNIEQLLKVNKNSEALVLIDMYLKYWDNVDSLEINKYINQKVIWFNYQLNKSYSPVEDIYDIIKKRGFNDFIGFVCIQYIEIEFYKNGAYNENGFNLLANYLDKLSKFVPKDSRLFSSYIILNLIEKIQFNSSDIAHLGGQGMNKSYENLKKDSLNSIKKLPLKFLDKNIYPSLNRLFANATIELSKISEKNIFDYFKNNEFGKYDKSLLFSKNYQENFLRLIEYYKDLESRYISFNELNPMYHSYLNIDQLIYKLLTPNLE